jgi:hypothetical protein
VRDGVGERIEIDVPGEAAVADSLEFAVPARRGRHISTWMSESSDGFKVTADAAECDRDSDRRIAGNDRTCGNGFRCGDSGALKLEFGQARASRGFENPMRSVELRANHATQTGHLMPPSLSEAGRVRPLRPPLIGRACPHAARLGGMKRPRVTVHYLTRSRMAPPMNQPLKHLLLLVTMAAVSAVSATAQPVKPIAQWTNLNQLKMGSEIRVGLTGGKTVTGFLQSVSPDSLAINAATSQESLARQDIKLVSLKRPGHRGRNTLIGLSIGAAGGLATGAAIDRATPSRGWFNNFGLAVFTPIGAIIGTVVGVAIPTGGWRVVYRVP